MRYAIAITLLVLSGCGIIVSDDVSTTTPNADQIAYCREVMYINPEIEIEPLGYAIVTGMDDLIRFKFIARVDDPSTLFDASQVDATQFAANFDPYALHPKASDPWWDLSSKTLVGGNFSVPPPNSTGTRGLNIAYTNNEAGTLTVYVLWHET